VLEAIPMFAESTIFCLFTTKGIASSRLNSFCNANGFNWISDVIQEDREFITTKFGQRIVIVSASGYFACARTRDRVGSSPRVL